MHEYRLRSSVGVDGSTVLDVTQLLPGGIPSRTALKINQAIQVHIEQFNRAWISLFQSRFIAEIPPWLAANLPARTGALQRSVRARRIPRGVQLSTIWYGRWNQVPELYARLLRGRIARIALESAQLAAAITRG